MGSGKILHTRSYLPRSRVVVPYRSQKTHTTVCSGICRRRPLHSGVETCHKFSLLRDFNDRAQERDCVAGYISHAQLIHE